MYGACGLPIPPCLPTAADFYEDVDEVEEVTIDTSDEDEEDSFADADANGNEDFGGEMMGYDYGSNVATTSSGGVKRSFDTISPPKISKKKKKRNRSRSRANKRARISMENSQDGNDNSICPEEIWSQPGMKKYWHNRYELFSKYDEGIKLDLGL